ncbi:hypothetical protein Fmac_024602 [Flemingia macrophylla]|uniref:Acylamino-acid-releasing enzyme N-terminal domain-containing protein n=1 Tax=Flemingia macrophylla TaxID=520843 RepID=A0ABD1LPV0_9FABA
MVSDVFTSYVPVMHRFFKISDIFIYFNFVFLYLYHCILTFQWSSYMNKVTCLKFIKYHLMKLNLLLKNISMNCVPGTVTIIHEFSTSQDGKFLVFLSAKSVVDTGVHNATNSLHRIDWPTDGKLFQNL